MNHAEEVVDSIAQEIASTRECSYSAGEIKEEIYRASKLQSLAKGREFSADEVVDLMEKEGATAVTAKTVVTRDQIMRITEQVCSQHSQAGFEGADMDVDGEYRA